jgi:IclR family pca regulon transcriptional regulator
MSAAIGVGTRLPAFATSMGRVLLAAKSDPELGDWLRHQTFRSITPHTLVKTKALKTEVMRVRRQGYAFVSQELELGLCSIAVPIRSTQGEVVCGINVSMRYSDKVKAIALKQMLPALHVARQAIEQALTRSNWQPLTTKHP